MKAKVIILGMCGALLMSSCGTVGSGAATGGYLGGMFGSAIGGLTGGWRGHHVGTVIGMATGAVVGAAAGAAEEQKRERTIQEYHNRVAARQSYRQNQYQQDYGSQYDDSGYDGSNSGDDRLYDFNPSGNVSSSSTYSPSSSSTYSPSYNGGNGISASALADRYAIDIRNVHFVGEGAGNTLRRGESAKIIFELKNVSGHMLYDIVPNVMETTNNRRIIISPSMRIESIAPGQTLRYTAMVRATQSLKAGEAHFVVTVSQGNKTASGVKDIVVYTSKR